MNAVPVPVYRLGGWSTVEGARHIAIPERGDEVADGVNGRWSRLSESNR
jgi:hypothetical protein